jgi:uncharacterized protein with von Willebrand factor type A (vWA) domain
MREGTTPPPNGASVSLGPREVAAPLASRECEPPALSNDSGVAAIAADEPPASFASWPLATAPDESIVAFGRYLRANGLAVGPREAGDLVRAAAALALDGDATRRAWRAIVCGSLAEWQRYPGLHAAFWHPQRGGRTRVAGEPRRATSIAAAVQRMRQSMETDAQRSAPSAETDTQADAPTAPGRLAQGGASRTEPLEPRRGERWTIDDQGALERLGAELAQALRRRPTRRLHPDPRGERVDLRRTLRASLQSGGLPVVLARRRRRRELPRVVVAVDASRSMEAYSQLLVRFAKVAVERLDARAFVFHTRIAEVTDLLRLAVSKVQERINAVTFGFGSGTRIAACLDDLIDVHLRGTLDRRTLLLVASDGFDSEPPPRLAAALDRVQRRGARVAWLHPLRAATHSRALEAAAPHIDLLFPAPDVRALRALPAALAHLRP